MKIGMLWFDDDPRRALDEKVLRAAAYYQQKYGRQPTVCFVHPSALGSQPNPPSKTAANSVQIRSARNVLPNHFWVGISEGQ